MTGTVTAGMPSAAAVLAAVRRGGQQGDTIRPLLEAVAALPPQEQAPAARCLLDCLWSGFDARFPWVWAFEQRPAAPAAAPPEWLLAGQVQAMAGLCEKYRLGHDSALVLRACARFAEGIGCPPTMEQVAAHLQVSKDYLGKLFKQKTSMTFTRYTTMLKMQYAGKLLGSGRYKVYEISEQLGYQTTDYFTRLFKQHMGRCPRVFRFQAPQDAGYPLYYSIAPAGGATR